MLDRGALGESQRNEGCVDLVWHAVHAVDPPADHDLAAGGTEWEDVAPRCWAMVGDDLEAAAELLGRVDQLRGARAAAVRSVLGVRDVRHVGPSLDWPLVVVIVDEAHSFLAERRGDRAAEALAAVCRHRVESLVRMGLPPGLRQRPRIPGLRAGAAAEGRSLAELGIKLEESALPAASATAQLGLG
jgi:hypothetical protein